MTDATEETDGELLARLGMHADRWCDEMKARGVVPPQFDVEPGSSFHAWMCNAIMNAYDIGYWAAKRELPREVKP